MILDVHHLRRFCSRTADPLEKGTLASLKSEYERMKHELDNMDKEIAVSKLRKQRFSGEVFSPYEDLLINRYAVSFNLAKVAIGILSYGYLEMVEMFIDLMPTPEQFDIREVDLIGGVLGGLVLPLPPDLRDGYYLRRHLEELREWYDKHKDNLIWDEENLRFYLPDNEKDEFPPTE